MIPCIAGLFIPQLGYGGQAESSAASMQIVDLSLTIPDFADTDAAVAALDFVFSINTPVVDLTDALWPGNDSVFLFLRDQRRRAPGGI
jgi:hypothetical protein